MCSTVGVFSTVGGYLEYRGRYHDKCGGYLEYRPGVQYHGDIMSAMGVILSTVRDTQYCGGYHDACRGYHEYRGGTIFCYLSTPWYS